MPLEDAKKMNIGGNSAEFLQLLKSDGGDYVDGDKGKDCSNEDGDVSNHAIRESMRQEMVHFYTHIGNGDTRRWVEFHVDLLSIEARKECATTFNG